MKIQWSRTGQLQTFEEFPKYDPVINGFRKVRDWVDVPRDGVIPRTESSNPVDCVIFNVSTSTSDGNMFHVSSHKTIEGAIEGAKSHAAMYYHDIYKYNIHKAELK